MQARRSHKYLSFPRREVRREFKQFLNEERRDLLEVIAVIAVAVCAVTYFNRNYFGGLVVGFLLTFTVTMIVIRFLLATAGLQAVHGVLGEDWTNEMLRDAVKQGNAWFAIDNVELQRGDIDHLLITPGGVVVVETKNYATKATAGYLPQHVDDARKARMRAEGLLTTLGFKDVSIHALLVVWGRGSSELPATQAIDGVLVVPGADVAAVLKRFATGRVGLDCAEQVRQAILRFRMGVVAARQ